MNSQPRAKCHLVTESYEAHYEKTKFLPPLIGGLKQQWTKPNCMAPSILQSYFFCFPFCNDVTKESGKFSIK